MSLVNSTRPIVSFSNVSAGYGRVPVFRDLTFALARGESACLLGRNGCGKSTLLRCVLGLTDILSGAIKFDGTDVGTIRRYALASMGIGYVPQGRGDFPSLTVEENIRLAALCRTSLSPSQIVDLVLDKLPMIASLRSRRVAHLSGGERTMVALARILAMQPDLRLLLLDELSSGLSPENLHFVRTLLQQMCKEGTTILMAEQNVTFAKSLPFRLLEPHWEIGIFAREQEVS